MNMTGSAGPIIAPVMGKRNRICEAVSSIGSGTGKDPPPKGARRAQIWLSICTQIYHLRVPTLNQKLVY